MAIGEISKRLGLVILERRCPACDAWDSMQRGPQGGLSVNVRCSACGTKYNVCGPFGAQWIGHDD